MFNPIQFEIVSVFPIIVLKMLFFVHIYILCLWIYYSFHFTRLNTKCLETDVKC